MNETRTLTAAGSLAATVTAVLSPVGTKGREHFDRALLIANGQSSR